jgi:hypothetical protein
MIILKAYSPIATTKMHKLTQKIRRHLSPWIVHRTKGRHSAMTMHLRVLVVIAIGIRGCGIAHSGRASGLLILIEGMAAAFLTGR